MQGERSTLSFTRGAFLALAGVVILLCTVVGYAIQQRRTAAELESRNQTLAASLSDTRTQVDALSGQIRSMEESRVSQPPAKPVHARSAKAATAHRADDPRWKAVNARLDEQGNAIATTQQDLSNTRTELQGSIATTHDELVKLEKKGDRQYYEFDIDKSKQFQHAGPIAISLRKANTKHEYADLEMRVDDVEVSKKHVNIFEPAVFYPGDETRPVEVVINSVGKNHVHGYISTPKYTERELAQTADPKDASGAESASSETTAPSAGNARRKLEVSR